MSDDGGTRIDYELADELEVSTPVQAKAIESDLRLAICDLVLERAMTVTEIAARFERPRGSIAYHVDILVDAGLLQVVRTRKVRAMTERFYGRTARTFLVDRPTDSLPFVRELAAATDFDAMHNGGGIHTLRFARIPVERMAEFDARLLALAVEFTEQPRAGETEHALLIITTPTRRSGSGTNGDHPSVDPTE